MSDDTNVVRLPVPDKGRLREVVEGQEAPTLTFGTAWWGARSERLARKAHNDWLAAQVRAGTDERKRW